MTDTLTHRPARSEDGFTLIELLIVIVILGVLATVVVFAVGGITDRGSDSSAAADASTITTAQEAYRAQNGTYGDEAALVAGGFLRAPSKLHDITLTSGGADYLVVAASTAGGGNGGGGGGNGGGGGGNPTPPPPPVGPTTVACSDAGTPSTVAGFSAMCYGDEDQIGNTVLVITHSPYIRIAITNYVTNLNGNMNGVLLLVDDPAMVDQADVSAVVSAVSWRGVTAFDYDETFVDGGQTVNPIALIDVATGVNGTVYQQTQYVWGTFAIG